MQVLLLTTVFYSFCTLYGLSTDILCELPQQQQQQGEDKIAGGGGGIHRVPILSLLSRSLCMHVMACVHLCVAMYLDTH